jgi:sugar phosphate permease
VDTGSTGSSSPDWGDFRRVFTSRAVWTICAMSFAAYSLYLFFNSWMPTYLNTEFDVGLVTSGVFTAVFPAIGILGRGSSGFISDRVFNGRRRPVAIGTFALTVPIVTVIASLRTALLLVAFMILAGFFVQLAIGLFYTYVQETVEDNVTGTALALFGLISFIGAFTAPAIAGVLIERTGAYLAAFGYAGLLAVIGVALAWIAPRN